MMDETEIDRVCRQDPYIKRYYIGTFAVDEVPRQLMPNTTFVVNLNRLSNYVRRFICLTT